MNCYLFEAPTYLFYAPDLPALLYYSHIPIAVLALLVGSFVFFKGRHLLLNRLLFVISLLFTVWILASLFAWTNVHGDFLAFIWPLFGITAAALAIYSVYFVYVFADKKDVSIYTKLIFLTLLAPVLLLGHTDLSISGFNIAVCDAFAFEGLAFKVYYTALGFLAMAWILYILITRYRRADKDTQKQIVLLGAGVELFLLMFISTTFIVTYLTSLGYFEDSRLEFFGLFGMGFFMVMMGVLIVRFKTFSIGAHAAKALIVALAILIASKYTFDRSVTDVILTTITLVLVLVVGYMLIRSVQKEVAQREEIEKLAGRLEKANKRLKELDKMKSEFVSIASHQLRSPLTAIRGYSSMMLEGSYGQLPEKAKDVVERIGESSRLMALSVEDYLNVSRIQSGNMKYELSDFNVADKASKIADDMRQEAVRKGLLLTFKNKLDTSKGVTHADVGKTHQILHNLVDNAMKYTPKGSIEISVRESKKPKMVHIDVTDSGIGMNPETIDGMFEKFERAENANEVNVTGTGLGLYIARKMAQDMGGDVSATSDGEGKGSTFTLSLPLHM